MKKTYIIPKTCSIQVTGGAILIGVSDGTTITNENKNTFEYVKEDRSSSSYNVWNDDWSE